MISVTSAPDSLTNAATVSGGGSANASASDATTIDALPVYSSPLAFAVPASVIGGVPTTFAVTYASQAASSALRVPHAGRFLGHRGMGPVHRRCPGLPLPGAREPPLARARAQPLESSASWRRTTTPP